MLKARFSLIDNSLNELHNDEHYLLRRPIMAGAISIQGTVMK